MEVRHTQKKLGEDYQTVEITGLTQINQHEVKYRVLLQKCVQQCSVSLDSFSPPSR